MARKKKTEEIVTTIEWDGEGSEPVKDSKPKKKRSGSYSKTKGSTYERQIVKELKELTGSEEISTSRSSSKKLDDIKIDIHDESGTLPC